MDNSFDSARRVVVVGGGAAGMMAAIHAAQNGARVTLLERNSHCGKKLKITGKGRCNVTNACDVREFLLHVPTNPRFLYSALNCFSTEDTMSFFEESGVPLKVERGRRVFPVSDRAEDIVSALYLPLIIRLHSFDNLILHRFRQRSRAFVKRAVIHL